MKQIKITNKDNGQRIDKYIRKYLNNAPLSFIYKLFRKKDIKVNGKKADISYILKENDLIPREPHIDTVFPQRVYTNNIIRAQSPRTFCPKLFGS